MTPAPPLRIAFTVHGQPAPAGSKRHVGNGRIVDSSRRAAPWKNLVAEYAAQAMADLRHDEGRLLLIGPLAVKMVFHVVRPKAHYRITKFTDGSPSNNGLRLSAPTWPTTRPDVLKLARAVEDACTGIIWRDDAQIVSETLVKKYGEPARVEVTVMEA